MGTISNFVREKISEREAAKSNYRLKRIEKYFDSPELLVGNPKAISEMKRIIAKEQRYNRRLLDSGLRGLLSDKNIDGLSKEMTAEETQEAEEELKRIMAENEQQRIIR